MHEQFEQSIAEGDQFVEFARLAGGHRLAQHLTRRRVYRLDQQA
ncbi:hypothetical protein [Nocardia pseudobrasiliensis]|nr:hypothetical protein [Nocardia pseudobrasiliensis]